MSLTKNDIIFASLAGLLVSWLAIDFLGLYGLAFVVIFPILSVIGLYITEYIGEKKPFVKQIGKFFLIGSFADVIDIKVFQLLFWLAPFSLTFKTISFLTATFVKYWVNKHWAFEKPEKDGIKKEAIQFFGVTLIGLTLNVSSFYYFTKILGTQFGLSSIIWTELSIIFAALVAAVWNFLGYKFLVFKK